MKNIRDYKNDFDIKQLHMSSYHKRQVLQITF